MDREQVRELLLQALETELGAAEIYGIALECAVDENLRAEWQAYFAQSNENAEALRRVLEDLGIHAAEESPGRNVVRELGEALVEVIHLARESGDPDVAQLVAAECVLLAETKDRQNWDLISRVAQASEGDEWARLVAAHRKIEAQEGERHRQSAGWARELWIQSLGLPAVLPPQAN